MPNVGKSTLFKALTQNPIDISNYPFCTIEPNKGIVQVPDSRLQKLAEISQSKKIVPTIIQFVDIAGLVKGANKGEGLGNQFLTHIREVNAILHVVRCFQDEKIIHVEKAVNPIRDIDIINTELILKDLETIDKRLVKVEKEARGRKKGAELELQVLKDLKNKLDQGVLAIYFLYGLEPEKRKFVDEIFLLSAKPQIFVLNSNTEEIDENLKQKIKEMKSSYLVLNLKDELDFSELNEQERKEFGVDKLKLGELINKSYEILTLITFFTTGEDETRAWTIKKGTKAPQAAAVIHTDFEKKFICSKVVEWQKLLETGGWKKCAEKGILRTEGKDYIVQDGDVIEIMHN